MAEFFQQERPRRVIGVQLTDLEYRVASDYIAQHGSGAFVSLFQSFLSHQSQVQRKATKNRIADRLERMSARQQARILAVMNEPEA